MNETSPLYSPAPVFHSGHVDTEDGHSLYYEECGAPGGYPMLLFHGGPGSGMRPGHRQFFDPSHYRIIAFDQRGAGRSRPGGDLTRNTMEDQLADIECLRIHFGVTRWMLFGGSWGSTLALAYAQAFPERVTGMLLCSVFLGTKREIDWLFEEGQVSRFFPEAWEAFRQFIPVSERHELLEAYFRRVTSPDEAQALAATREWERLENAVSRLVERPPAERPDREAVNRARIELHYFRNECFLKAPLVDRVDRHRDVPAVIVEGRYDMTCPYESAWRLHRAWPEARFVTVPDAGHLADEPGMARALRDAADELRGLARRGSVGATPWT